MGRVACRRKSVRKVATRGVGMLTDGGCSSAVRFQSLNPVIGPTTFDFVIRRGGRLVRTDAPRVCSIQISSAIGSPSGRIGNGRPDLSW